MIDKLRSSYPEINIPVLERGLSIRSGNEQIGLAFVITTLFVFLLGHDRLEKHDRGGFALRALNTLEKMDHFLRGIISIHTRRQQSCCPVGRFDRNFESASDCSQCNRLWSAFSIDELIDDRAVQITRSRAIGLGPPAFVYFGLEPLCKTQILTHEKHFVTFPVSMGSRFVAQHLQL
jgi:hypothetical protein